MKHLLKSPIGFLWNHAWSRALLGFLSIYGIWIIPSWIFQWDSLDATVYALGDHIVLPIFNCLAFAILPAVRLKPYWKYAVFVPPLLVGTGVTVTLFAGDNQKMLGGEIDTQLDILHILFTFAELNFIVFTCALFSFLPHRRIRNEILIFTLLYILVFSFLIVAVFTQTINHRGVISAFTLLILNWTIGLFRLNADGPKKNVHRDAT